MQKKRKQGKTPSEEKFTQDLSTDFNCSGFDDLCGRRLSLSGLSARGSGPIRYW